MTDESFLYLCLLFIVLYEILEFCISGFEDYDIWNFYNNVRKYKNRLTQTLSEDGSLAPEIN
jgi:hypothetical protein